MTGDRLVRTVHPVAIQQPRTRLGQIAVPDLVGVFGHHDTHFLVIARRVEQAQIDPFGMRREQREIDAFAVPGRAQRIGLSGPYPGRSHSRDYPYASSVSIRIPSGGNCNRNDWLCPCIGWGSASTAPALPTPLPP